MSDKKNKCEAKKTQKKNKDEEAKKKHFKCDAVELNISLKLKKGLTIINS